VNQKLSTLSDLRIKSLLARRGSGHAIVNYHGLEGFISLVIRASLIASRFQASASTDRNSDDNELGLCNGGLLKSLTTR
jgi:hypothetical protein